MQKADYIYLHGGGATTIYRNVWSPGSSGPHFAPLPSADGSGISQRAEEITFTDIDGSVPKAAMWKT
jgi:hypothetical protein